MTKNDKLRKMIERVLMTTNWGNEIEIQTTYADSVPVGNVIEILINPAHSLIVIDAEDLYFTINYLGAVKPGDKVWCSVERTLEKYLNMLYDLGMTDYHYWME